MSRLRLAFLGIDHPHGAGWRDSLELCSDELELVAFVPRFDGALTSLEERYAHLPRFESVAELVDWGAFDLALICLPDREGAEAVVQLALAGKGILLEKPGALSAADFAPAAAAVRQSGVAFQAGYLWRYDSAADRLRAMVAEGRFGDLISIDMRWVTANVRLRNPAHYLFDPAVCGGGFFQWLGCHWLNLLPWITGLSVSSVLARLGRYGGIPTPQEDGGAVILELEQRVLVTLTGGYWLPRWTGESQWTLRGTERWVHWDANVPGTGGVLTIHGPKPHFQAMDEVFALPADPTPGYGGASTQRLLRDWINQSKSKECSGRADLASTVATLELLDAIRDSAGSGRLVTLPRPGI